MDRKEKMGFGWLLAAGLFLWNPVVGMVDVLPDIIGYLLLLVGLARLADLNDSLGEAVGRFRTMVWVSLGELLAQLLLRFYIRRTTVAEDYYNQIQPSWILLFTFMMLIAEVIFLIPAYRSFLRGLDELTERREAVHRRIDRRGNSRYERLGHYVIPFVVGKNLLALLPELTSLTTYEYAYGKSGKILFDWYSYADFLRTLLLVPALILTSVWLIRWVAAFAAGGRDRNFQERLTAEYNETVLPDTGLLLGRRVRLSFLLFRVAMAFSASWLFLDSGETAVSLLHGVDVLPDCCAVFLLALGVWFLRTLDAPRRIEIGVAIPAFAAGLSEWILCRMYFRKFSASDALRLADAYDRMLLLRVVGCCAAAWTCACFLLLFCKLMRLTRDHLQTDSHRGPEGVRGRIAAGMSLSCLIAASRMADLILRPWSVRWIWWITVLLTAALILVSSSLFSDLSEELLTRYPPKKKNAFD